MRSGTGVRCVLLAALLALGGCNAPFGAGTPSDATLTPVAVPSDAEATGPEELAPGLTRAGVADPTRLGAAHARILSNASYTVHRNVTRRDEDGTLAFGTDVVLRRAAFGDRFRYILAFRGRDRRVVERYADGERIYERERAANETTYALVGAADGPLDPRDASFGALTNRRGVVDLFTRFRFEVTGRIERGGTTHYRLATPEPRDLPPLRNVTVRALVSERGLVREYSVSYLVVRDDAATRVDVTVRFSDLGTTAVAEPAWYDDARAATNGTGTADDRPASGPPRSAVPSTLPPS